MNWPRGSQFTARHTKKLPTIWWIKSHNSGMKNWNFTKKYTDHKTINSNNYAKFEMNWPRGSQFTARHTKNCLQFDELSPITVEWKIEISPKSIQTVRPSIPINMRSLKWIGQGVLKLERDMWNGRTDRRTLVYRKNPIKIWLKIKIQNIVSKAPFWPAWKWEETYKIW